MKLLLTGASGFVGRACVRALSDTVGELHLVSRKTLEQTGAAGTQSFPGFVRFVESNQLKLEAIRPTHLLHLAWVTTPGEYWMSSWPILTGFPASLHLVKEFVRCGGRRLVITGSSAEYDWTEGGVFHEYNSPIAPATLYGVCKHALHSVVEAYCKQTRVSNAWARLFFLYGPSEHPKRLVASVIRAGLAGQSIECSDGLQKRDFIYVGDAGRALVDFVISVKSTALST